MEEDPEKQHAGEGADELSPMPTSKPEFQLSTVSKAYDRGNKGYLDETEQKLRAMDSENLGHLSVDKMYALMQEFQEEQKKALTLRRVVFALVGFAILLCLANIGTSFAAAKLAKDLSVQDGALISLQSGDFAATRHEEDIIDLDPPDPIPANETGNGTVSENLNGTGTRGLQIQLGGSGTARSPLTISVGKVRRKDLSLSLELALLCELKSHITIPCFLDTFCIG